MTNINDFEKIVNFFSTEYAFNYKGQNNNFVASKITIEKDYINITLKDVTTHNIIFDCFEIQDDNIIIYNNDRTVLCEIERTKNNKIKEVSSTMSKNFKELQTLLQNSKIEYSNTINNIDNITCTTLLKCEILDFTDYDSYALIVIGNKNYNNRIYFDGYSINDNIVSLYNNTVKITSITICENENNELLSFLDSTNSEYNITTDIGGTRSASIIEIKDDLFSIDININKELILSTNIEFDDIKEIKNNVLTTKSGFTIKKVTKQQSETEDIWSTKYAKIEKFINTKEFDFIIGDNVYSTLTQIVSLNSISLTFHEHKVYENTQVNNVSVNNNVLMIDDTKIIRIAKNVMISTVLTSSNNFRYMNDALVRYDYTKHDCMIDLYNLRIYYYAENGTKYYMFHDANYDNPYSFFYGSNVYQITMIDNINNTSNFYTTEDVTYHNHVLSISACEYATNDFKYDMDENNILFTNKSTKILISKYKIYNDINIRTLSSFMANGKEFEIGYNDKKSKIIYHKLVENNYIVITEDNCLIGFEKSELNENRIMICDDTLMTSINDILFKIERIK